MNQRKERHDVGRTRLDQFGLEGRFLMSLARSFRRGLMRIQSSGEILTISWGGKAQRRFSKIKKGEVESNDVNNGSVKVYAGTGRKRRILSLIVRTVGEGWETPNPLITSFGELFMKGAIQLRGGVGAARR